MRELKLRHEYNLPTGVTSAVIEYGGRGDVAALRRLSGNKDDPSLLYEVEFTGTEERESEFALFREMDMVFMFGVHVVSFLNHPACRRMTRDMYAKFNFGVSLADTTDYDDLSLDFGWTIQSAWIADGTYEGEIAGFIYGRDAADGKVYPLDMYTFLFGVPLNKELDKGERRHHVIQSRVGRVLSLFKKMERHLGKEIMVNNPKGRGFSANVDNYIFPGLVVHYRDNTGECSRAAVANGMFVLGYIDDAAIFWAEQMEFIERKNELGELSTIRDHSDMSKEVQKYGYSLEIIRNERNEKLRGKVDVRWFHTGQCCGVYIATLVAKSGYKHDVAIDARQCPLVYDCQEFSVLRYSEGCLQACMGDYAEFAYMTDVRKLVPPGNRNKRSRSQRRTDAKRHKNE